MIISKASEYEDGEWEKMKKGIDGFQIYMQKNNAFDLD